MQSFFKRPIVAVVSMVIVLAIPGLILFAIFYPVKKVSTGPAPVVVEQITTPIRTVIGKSVQGREIEAYSYGSGAKHLLFVGGVHGGYEWNSVVVAFNLLDYLNANPTAVPANLTVTVIPDANPDGVYKVIGKEGRFTAVDVPAGVSTVPGRFNAHDVDLNRNFDCKWQTKSTWQNKVVSGGASVFSEPESQALRDFILKDKPASVVFWHSQSGNVYASRCAKGTLPETIKIMNIYAAASGYKAVETFDAYETSGDAEGWLASIDVPAITVELKTHQTVEWEQNLAGVKAIFEYYK